MTEKSNRETDVQALHEEGETGAGTNPETMGNTKLRDNASKMVFGDPVMCAQFLRGYSNIDLLKNVRPEDIEDVTERFLPLFQESKDSDTVKKIRIPEQNRYLYVIAIIEHQSRVHFDMTFRMLQYITYVLEDYRREQEKQHSGITRTKDFKYPPVLPIVYYEGSNEWTAVRNFKDRVELSDALGAYIPDFEYLLVPLTSYSDQDIIEKNDELSLVMLINKLRRTEDFKKLRDIPPEYFEHFEKETPEYLLALIAMIISALLRRLNVPDKEIDTLTDQIQRREFEMMFDSFEAYDVQAARREWLAEGRIEGQIEERINSIFELLEELGSIPKEIGEKISSETDMERLKRWFKLASRSSTMDEFVTKFQND